MRIKVVIHPAEEGGFWAEVPGFPGCVSEGETLEEVRANIREALAGVLEVMQEQPLEEPSRAAGDRIEALEMKHVTGAELCRALERRGWTLARIRGSHYVYNRPGARRPIPVPVHGNHLLKSGTQRSIMREAGLSEDDL